MLVWIVNLLLWCGIIWGAVFLVNSGIVPLFLGIIISVVGTGITTTITETFRKVK